MQMDLKIPGIPVATVMDCVKKSWQARKEVICAMNSIQSSPRTTPKRNAPIIKNLNVSAQKRSNFVGLGGFNLKKLRSDTGVTVTPIDETTFQIFAPNTEAMTEAREIIDTLLADEAPELEFGAAYSTKVVEIREYGVMVEIHPSIPPVLIHNQQLDTRKVRHPSALNIEIGSELMAKFFGRDPANGQIRLSRKALLSPASSTVKNLHPT